MKFRYNASLLALNGAAHIADYHDSLLPEIGTEGATLTFTFAENGGEDILERVEAIRVTLLELIDADKEGFAAPYRAVGEYLAQFEQDYKSHLTNISALSASDTEAGSHLNADTTGDTSQLSQENSDSNANEEKSNDGQTEDQGEARSDQDAGRRRNRRYARSDG